MLARALDRRLAERLIGSNSLMRGRLLWMMCWRSDLIRWYRRASRFTALCTTWRQACLKKFRFLHKQRSSPGLVLEAPKPQRLANTETRQDRWRRSFATHGLCATRPTRNSFVLDRDGLCAVRLKIN